MSTGSGVDDIVLPIDRTVAGRRRQQWSLIRARRFLPVSIVLAGVGVGVLLQGGSDAWTWVLGLVLVELPVGPAGGSVEALRRRRSSPGRGR